MKRFMVALVAVMFLVGFNSFAFADEKAGGGAGEMKGEMKAGDKEMEKKEEKKEMKKGKKDKK